MKTKGRFLKAFSKLNVSKGAKIWFTIPAIIFVVALVVIISLGATSGSYTDAVGIGIDFEGGTMLTVRLGEEAVTNYDENVAKIKDAIQKHGVTVSYIQLQQANNPTQTSIAFRYKNTLNDDAAIAELNDKIIASVDALYPELVNDDVNFITYESIGATAATDLLSKAAIAVVVSTLLILIYIMFRFTMVSGFAAILALLHDVLIMFCLTVICRIQINTSFIAAMITIIAYSINNTIIIFDRCREEIKPLKGQKNINYTEIGDKAVRDNMTRSIYTTATTMVTIIFLAILGSDTIREFCVPIILGLLAGLYSSVFLATPMWSKMSYAYDKTKAKYASRHEISYDKKNNEEEVDLTYRKEPDDDEADDFTPKQAKRAADKKPAQKGKTIYKYSKKNTKFKKK